MASSRMRTQEVSSSLPLQMLLYFNCFFSAMYLVLNVMTLSYRLDNLSWNMKAFDLLLAPFSLGAWALAEPFRLGFGMYGNLQDNVPSLFAFVVITVFPTIPVMLVRTFAQVPFLPFDSAAGFIQLMFLCSQLPLSLASVCRLIDRKTASFFQLIRAEEDSKREGGGGGGMGGSPSKNSLGSSPDKKMKMR
jgi:transmembrane protein 17